MKNLSNSLNHSIAFIHTQRTKFHSKNEVKMFDKNKAKRKKKKIFFIIDCQNVIQISFVYSVEKRRRRRFINNKKNEMKRFISLLLCSDGIVNFIVTWMWRLFQILKINSLCASAWACMYPSIVQLLTSNAKDIGLA